jgi:4-hydroxybenzoate polyprenyltransferase
MVILFNGKQHALNVYIISVLLSLFLAAYLAESLHKWSFFWLAPVSLIFLWLYSFKLKNHFLLGNIGVSLFGCLILVLIWLSEIDSIQLNRYSEYRYDYIKIRNIFFIYGLFIFTTTWIRELIKDAEDIIGDSALHINTFPIVFGLKKTNLLVGILCFITISLIIGVFVCNFGSINNFQILLGTFLIFTPILIVLVHCFKNLEKHHYTLLSRLLKVTMVGGIFYLLTL